LGSDDAAWPQRAVEKLEVGLLEEALGRTLGIRRVGDDDVKGLLVIVEELEAVANVDLDLWVLEANRHARQVLLGETDNSLVSVLVETVRTSVLNCLWKVPRQCRTGQLLRCSRA